MHSVTSRGLPYLGLRVGVRLDAHPRQNLGGRRGQPQGRQVVDLVQIVELGRQQHLLGVVEGAVLEIQAGFQLVDLVEVIEVAETVERKDFGDFVRGGVLTSVHGPDELLLQRRETG